MAVKAKLLIFGRKYSDKLINFKDKEALFNMAYLKQTTLAL